MRTSVKNIRGLTENKSDFSSNKAQTLFSFHLGKSIQLIHHYTCLEKKKKRQIISHHYIFEHVWIRDGTIMEGQNCGERLKNQKQF